MSTIINGTTDAITFPDATIQNSAGLTTGGTIATGTITSATLPTATVTTLKAPSGVLATQNGMTGIAKAWAQFSYATGSMVVQSSFNISSITRTGTGLYTLNFTTSMPSANYSAVMGCASGDLNAITVAQAGQSTSAFPMRVGTAAGSYVDDKTFVYATIFSS